jgi:hypothetical protein
VYWLFETVGVAVVAVLVVVVVVSEKDDWLQVFVIDDYYNLKLLNR